MIFFCKQIDSPLFLTCLSWPYLSPNEDSSTFLLDLEFWFRKDILFNSLCPFVYNIFWKHLVTNDAPCTRSRVLRSHRHTSVGLCSNDIIDAFETYSCPTRHSSYCTWLMFKNVFTKDRFSRFKTKYTHYNIKYARWHTTSHITNK